MIAAWMEKACARAEEIFTKHGVKLTLGGEPTYVPVHPEGAEWSYAAVGPTKLGYARRAAEALKKNHLPGSAIFFCPGKSYPGEVNPRWVIKVLANRDGSPLFRPPTRGRPPGPQTLVDFTSALCKHLGVPSHWLELRDPHDPRNEILAMPLDHDGHIWRSARWPLEKKLRVLLATEGPAGLRLPLHQLPPALPRRALTVERSGNTLAVFFPPLLQKPFLELLAAVEQACRRISVARIELQGYVPSDEAACWTTVGFAADPGVLEVNLPACASWRDYAAWIGAVTSACESVGLRSWKESPWDPPQGTGGGNHLLWGGPSLDEHPFFTRPAWLASILRFWQHHPALAYLFTGCYVGASSQAPRPDESARDLYDIEMAYGFLESLPPGDHRELINETLRHLHTDVTGNAHRSEISFDKFWNTSWPAGALGLIEFRAIESLPRADWMAAVALLWTCLAAHLLAHPFAKPLDRLGSRLRDEFFLPQRLWEDLEEILAELRRGGFHLDRALFREIWNWRFPALLTWRKLTVRRALESWPLLCETPVEGGTTSRFVDTSMHRLEFCSDAEFAGRFQIHVAGRPLALRQTASGAHLAGLRYRRTNLYPALHPGIPVQLPLAVTLVDRKTGRIAANFEMGAEDFVFRPSPATPPHLGGKPCRGGRRGDLTCDLRLE
jgi:Uncharacterized protein conserved in bacteria